MKKKEDLENKKKIEALKQRREEAMKESGIATARAIGKSTEERDRQLETQTAKRYEKVGVSPIYANGTFSANSKKQVEEYGNRLTEDDKVPSLRKKKK